jgi:hypothetical protein
MPVRLSSGKKKRTRGGNGGLSEMAMFQQPTYNDLVIANKIAERRYTYILQKTAHEFNTASEEYDKYVKQLSKETGSTEAKDVDENENPNKNTKIAAAEKKINTKIDALNLERETAKTQYDKERTRIENEILRIRSDEKHAKEQAEIEERNRKTAMANMEKNKGTYLSPYLPTDDDILVNQTQSPQSSRNTAHTNLTEHYDQKYNMHFHPDFGGKRKMRKYKKSNKRKTKKSNKRKTKKSKTDKSNRKTRKK